MRRTQRLLHDTRRHRPHHERVSPPEAPEQRQDAPTATATTASSTSFLIQSYPYLFWTLGYLPAVGTLWGRASRGHAESFLPSTTREARQPISLYTLEAEFCASFTDKHVRNRVTAGTVETSWPRSSDAKYTRNPWATLNRTKGATPHILNSISHRTSTCTCTILSFPRPCFMLRVPLKYRAPNRSHSSRPPQDTASASSLPPDFAA